MWQCQKCETLNNDDKCVVCGEQKPLEQTPKVEVLPRPVYYNPVQPQNQVNNRYNLPENKSPLENIAIVFGMIIILSLSLLIIYLIALTY